MKQVFLLVWRELLRPVLLVIAITLVLAAIVEGPALRQFVYAVF